MKYTETSKPYNERRYGRPWMAIVTTSTTKDFTFLDWEGRNGCVGQFNFDADPGTLLAYGQKDIRKGKGGVDGYQICMPNGKLPGIYPCSAIDLRKLPLPIRVLTVAQAKITHAMKTRDTPNDGSAYSKQKVAEAIATIARYSAYLPPHARQTEQDIDAEDYLSGKA